MMLLSDAKEDRCFDSCNFVGRTKCKDGDLSVERHLIAVSNGLRTLMTSVSKSALRSASSRSRLRWTPASVLIVCKS